MNIVLFFIFLVANLTTVGVSMFTYGDRDKYVRGMIMGVHIPVEYVQNEEVQKICMENRKSWNKFQKINLVLSFVICFLIFIRLELFFIFWLVWLFGYIVYLNYLVIGPHKKMYQLKVKNAWLDEKTKRFLYVDLKTSAENSAMVFSWKIHLFVLGSILLTGGILFFQKNAGMCALNGWIFMVMSLFLSAILCGMHSWLTTRRNEVFSQNSEINFAVNQLMKSSWSKGLLAADIVNGVAWLILFVEMQKIEWIYADALILYLITQTISATVLFLPLVSLEKRKHRLLDMDTEPILVDDDEYWKTGFYYNPNDRRIFVQDRLCSTNYSLNMARPLSKVITAGLIGVMLLVLGGGIVLMFSLSTAKTSFLIKDSSVTIKASIYSCEFNIEEVQSIELLEEMPKENFFKTNGAATEDYSIGYFSGNKSGACMLFLYDVESEIIKIKLEEKVIFVNSRKSEEAKQWYKQLNDLM